MDDTLRSLGYGLMMIPALAAGEVLQAQSLGSTPVPCKGQIISRVEISARPPFEVKGSGFQRQVARKLGDLHATTNPNVVSRFLALHPGMPCSELRRMESERILRAQPYLSDATITVYPDDAGGVFLSVVTVDEISLVLGGGGSGAHPYVRSFRLGEENLLGEATSIVGSWRYSPDFRDNYELRVVDYQFLGRPYQLLLDGARNELGGVWGVEASHPFLSDLQKISWRTTFGSREDYRFFRRGPEPRSAVGLSRAYADAGGVIRIGPPGKLILGGGSLSYEDEMPDPFALAVGNGFTQRDTVPELDHRYARKRVTRVNALAGIRSVRYIRLTGMQSLDGVEDIRKGAEVSSLVGRGMSLLGGTERDVFASGDLYVGVGGSKIFSSLEGTIEGRRPDGSERWDGVLGSARLITFMRPTPRNTFSTSFEWAGGWKQRIPFQLTFADRDGGPRGYRDSWLAGGQRAVVRFEDKMFLGHLKQFASVGIAPFVDVGKLWEGDAPFGENTNLNTSVGFSLLASVPPRSQRMWRLDIMYPLNRDSGAKLKIRLFSRDYTSLFWKEPGDVNRNRERSIPTSVFNWP